MARNRIQFQKGLSEAGFVTLYGSEDLCRAALERWRWPQGFACPKCGGRDHCIVLQARLRHDAGPRKLYQCNGCRRQTSLTSGTIFNSTKVPLTTWFRAMYLITQTKQGISSIELGRRLGTTQTTAWKIKTKLAEVMRLASDAEMLSGRIEMDDAYLGGQRSGGKSGRGSPGKKPIVVAVETDDKKRPRRLKIRRIRASSGPVSKLWPSASLRQHQPSSPMDCVAFAASPMPVARTSPWSLDRGQRQRDTRRSNGSTPCSAISRRRSPEPTGQSARNTSSAISPSSNGAFNNRFDLAAMIPALGRAAAATKPKPYWHLKLADYGA